MNTYMFQVKAAILATSDQTQSSVREYAAFLAHNYYDINEKIKQRDYCLNIAGTLMQTLNMAEK